MSWSTELPTILRNIIQDTSGTPVYTDSRLSTQILVTAPILQMRVAFANHYVPDVANTLLTPDPTATTPRDDSFISLVCLMSAQNLVMSEIRDMTRQGIDIQDGDSRIKLSRDANSLKLMKQSYDQMFEEALYAYKTGGNDGLGQIIVGPYKYLFGPCGVGHHLYEGYRMGGLY